MSRLVKRPAALFSFIGVLILIPFFWRLVPSFAQGPQQPGGVAIASDVMQVALIRAGLSADAMCAAGLSANQASTVIANAKLMLAAHPTILSDADAAYAAACAAANALQRKIQDGHASQEEIASLPTATAAVAAAQAQRQAALDAILAAATQTLAPSSVAVLHTIAANHAWKLPIEFLTVERTETEWISLRNALSNERIAVKYEDAPNSTCQVLLAGARANPTVAAAKANAVDV